MTIFENDLVDISEHTEKFNPFPVFASADLLAETDDIKAWMLSFVTSYSRYLRRYKIVPNNFFFSHVQQNKTLNIEAIAHIADEYRTEFILRSITESRDEDSEHH